MNWFNLIWPVVCFATGHVTWGLLLCILVILAEMAERRTQ